MRGALMVAAMVVVVAAGAACFLLRGADEQAVQADVAPFQEAIARYLEANSMGMKVTEFESLEVAGDSASVLCRMQEASGLYGGVAVRWRFTFQRDAHGTWRVSEREAQ
ncbi:MAG: hypothetical protein ACYS1C_11675 [Planctomycetota bacterium]